MPCRCSAGSPEGDRSSSGKRRRPDNPAIATCAQQGRSVFDYLRQAVTACF